MTLENVHESIIQILDKDFGIKISDGDNPTMNEIGLDSLDITDLSSVLANKFGLGNEFFINSPRGDKGKSEIRLNDLIELVYDAL